MATHSMNNVLTLVSFRYHEHPLIRFGNILELDLKEQFYSAFELLVHVYKDVQHIKLPSLGFLVLIFKELQLFLQWVEHWEL